MRSYLLLFPLFMLLTSCVMYSRYPEEQLSLTKIKFAPSEKPVDIFFLNESKPQRDYIRISILEESVSTNTPQVGYLLEKLRQKSQELGADALLIVDKESDEMAMGEYDSKPRERMTGIAIRYVDNIQFIENQLSHVEVVSHVENNTQEIRFDSKGDPEENFENRSSLLAYYCSLHYLLETTQNWRFSETPVTGGTTLYRVHKKNDITQARLNTTAYKNGRYGEVKITILDGRTRSIKMHLHYNEEGQLEKRNWTDTNQATRYAGDFEVTHIYDRNNLLLAEHYYRKAVNKNSMEPFVTLYYHYYNADKLEEILKNEQVVKVSK